MRHGIFALHVTICVSAQIWPAYAWLGARVEPYVLGLPFALAWNVGWILAMFAGLLVYHLTAPPEERGDDE